MTDIPISALIGKHIVSVTDAVNESESVRFECSDGTAFRMYHSQDCCESVCLAEIIGDISDLTDATVIDAREETHEQVNPPGVTPPEYQDEFMWTFYILQTNKGAVTLRWHGDSNGYYSVSVSFVQATPLTARPSDSGHADVLRRLRVGASVDSGATTDAALDAAIAALEATTAYDRELIARMLEGSWYKSESVGEQIDLLRDADNRDADGVHTSREQGEGS